MAKKDSATRARPGPGRLSAEAAEALPDRLLDAAFALFSTRGFADTSMQQIAAEAGASTKTLYSRFGNKTEMLQAVIHRMIETTLRDHGAALGVDPREAEPLSVLTALFSRVARRLVTDAAGLNRLVLREAYRIPDFDVFASGAISRPASVVRACLEAWRERGLLPWLEEPDRAATLCVYMALDSLRIRMALGGTPTDEEAQAHVAFAMRHFLKGCGYRPEPA